MCIFCMKNISNYALLHKGTLSYLKMYKLKVDTVARISKDNKRIDTLELITVFD